MSEKKISVVMTASGRVKEYPAGNSIREVLEAVFNQRSGTPDYDPPEKLFVGGKIVLADGLTGLAIEFGEFQEQKYEELDAALEEWVKQRLRGKPKGNAA